MSLNDIRDETGICYGTASTCLNRLKRLGLVVHEGYNRWTVKSVNLKVGDIVEIEGFEGGRFRVRDFRAHLEKVNDPSETRDCKIEDLVKVTRGAK